MQPYKVVAVKTSKHKKQADLFGGDAGCIGGEGCEVDGFDNGGY